MNGQALVQGACPVALLVGDAADVLRTALSRFTEGRGTSDQQAAAALLQSLT